MVWWATSRPVQLISCITPCACVRGKVISSVCLSVITKITRSQALHICVCYNYHELVDLGEKLVFVHFELLNMAHLCYKIMHFSFSMPVVYRPHPLHVLIWLDWACSTSMQVRVAKSWSAYSYVYSSDWSASILAILRYNGWRAHGVCTLESSSFDLSFCQPNTLDGHVAIVVRFCPMSNCYICLWYLTSSSSCCLFNKRIYKICT